METNAIALSRPSYGRGWRNHAIGRHVRSTQHDVFGIRRSARVIEFATVRAIGFRAGALVISVLVGALLLAVAGAVIGAGSAWIAFNGNLYTPRRLL